MGHVDLIEGYIRLGIIGRCCAFNFTLRLIKQIQLLKTEIFLSYDRSDIEGLITIKVRNSIKNQPRVSELGTL